jgi:hypothetical protein
LQVVRETRDSKRARLRVRFEQRAIGIHLMEKDGQRFSLIKISFVVRDHQSSMMSFRAQREIFLTFENRHC